jgi:hypothetical protein
MAAAREAQEVAHYTKTAEQKRLAQGAIKRLRNTRGRKPLEKADGDEDFRTHIEGLGKAPKLPVVSMLGLRLRFPSAPPPRFTR